MYKVIGNEILHIVNISVCPYITDKHIYTLYVDNKRPIYCDAQPIFFFNISDAQRALGLSNCGARKICTVPERSGYVYDYYLILQLLEDISQKFTPNSMLLNCLNLLEDYCFDTMDFWTDLKNKNDQLAKIKYELSPNDIVYMTPVSPIEDIKEEYDFFRKIFAATFYFTTNTDIDQHFINEGYDRKELSKAIKYLIGHIVVSSVCVW